MANTQNRRPGGGGESELSQLGGLNSTEANTSQNPNQDRPDFVVRLRPDADRHPHRALRKALKYLGRCCGLRAVSVEEVQQ